MLRLVVAATLCLVALAPARAAEITLASADLADPAAPPLEATAVVPDDLAAPAPVVFVLHGAFVTGARVRAESGKRFETLAADLGWVIVYPSARKGLWNLGPGADGGSDLRDLDALLDDLAGRVEIDRSRVFAAGFSQGGALALAWACTEPGKLRAVAAVSMSLPVALEHACRTHPPEGVLLVHGTADPVIAFDGGETLIGPSHPIPLLGFDRSVEVFRAAKRCADPPATRAYDRADDRTAVARRTWTACRRGAVEAFAIEGGGHHWPHADSHFPFAALFGPITREIDGAAAIIGFFSRFR